MSLGHFVDVGIQAEYNDQTPGRGAVGRAGMTFKHPLPLGRGSWLQWRLLPVESINEQSQYSLIYSAGLNDRMRLAGFADYNVRKDATNRWVIEPELSFVLSGTYAALVEYRYNGFEQHTAGLRGSGLALGVRVSL